MARRSRIENDRFHADYGADVVALLVLSGLSSALVRSDAGRRAGRRRRWSTSRRRWR